MTSQVGKGLGLRRRDRWAVRPIIAVTALAGLLVGVAASPPPAAASGAPTSFTVTRLDDPAGSGSCTGGAGDDCSLRQALNAVPAGGSVALPAGTYVLTQGQLAVTKSVRLTGAGAKSTTIQQNATGARVLAISGSVTVRIDDVTITGGTVSGDGGGVGTSGATNVTLDRVQVTGNTATGDGGGIAATGGQLFLRQSTVSANRANYGGGIAGAAYVTADDDTISGNTATVAGGGVYSTANYSTTMTYDFDTIAGNTAPTGSALAEPDGGGSLMIEFSLVSGSCSAASGLRGYDGVVDDSTCQPSGVQTVVVVNDLKLGALADNGGQTPTMLPAPGSPAVDDAFADSITGQSDAVKAQIDSQCANYAVADGTSNVAVDQRGGYRPGGAHCDVGAVEVFTDTVAPTWPAQAALTATEVGAVTVSLSWPQASDDTAVRAYRITGGSRVQTVDASLTSVTLTHLEPQRAYHLAVVALDAAGNASPALSTDVTTTAVTAWPFLFVRGASVGSAPVSLSGDLTRGLYETTTGSRTVTLTDTVTGASRTVDSDSTNPAYTNPALPVISADGGTVAWRSAVLANGNTTDTISVLTGFGADLTGGTVTTYQVTGNLLTGLVLSGDGSRLFVDKGTAGTLVQLTGVNAGTTYPVSLGSSDNETQLTMNTTGTRLLQVVGNGPLITGATLVDLTNPTTPTSSQPFAAGLVDLPGSVVVGEPFWPVAVSPDFSTIAYREATSAAASTTQHATARVVVRSLDGSHPRYYGDTLPLVYNAYSGGWKPGTAQLALDARGDTLLYTAPDPDVSNLGGVSAYVATTSSGGTEKLVTRDDVGNARAVTEAWLTAAGDGMVAWIGAMYSKTYGDGGILAGAGDGQPDAGLFYTSADTIPPTWPSGAALTADGVGSTQLTLHWPAATDDKGVAAYVITGAPSAITTTANATSRTVTGLTPGATYHFSIVARDGGGNQTPPLTLDVTTPVTVAPGTAPLTVTANSDGTVSLTWDAASGATGYQIQRAVVTSGVAGSFTTLATVGASPVSYTDATADGVMTYRYVVQKIIGSGDPQPHTVTKDVTTAAVSIVSTSAAGTLVGGELEYGSVVRVAVTGQPHRTGTATLHYSDGSTPAVQHTASAPLSEGSVAGTYSAAVPLPADAASVQSVTGALSDAAGTGSGHTADRSIPWTATVGGRLDITVPSAQGFTGTLAISSDSTGFATSVPITASTGPEVLSAYLPAAPDVAVRVLGGHSEAAQTLTGISIGHGQEVARTTVGLDAASLTVHLGTAGADRRVSLYTPFTGNNAYETDSAGDVTVTGLHAGDEGVLTVEPNADDPCGIVLPTNVAVGLNVGNNDVSPTVFAPSPATLTGTVSTSDGSQPPYTAVTVVQTCNGQSRNASAYVAADGTYTVTGLVAGQPTTLTAVAGDSYAAASTDLGTLPAGTDRQDVELVPTGNYNLSIALHTQLGGHSPVDVALGWQDLVHYGTTVQVGGGFPGRWDPDGGGGTVRGVPGEVVTLCADGAAGGYGKGCVSAPLPAQGKPLLLDLTLHAGAQVTVTPSLPTGRSGAVTVSGTLECSPRPCTPQSTVSTQVYSASQSEVVLPAEGTWDVTFTSYDDSSGATAVAHRTFITGSGDVDLGTVALTVPTAAFSGSDNSLAVASDQTVTGGSIQLTAHWRASRAVSGAGTLAVTVPQGTSVPAANAVRVNGVALAGGYTVDNGVLQIPVGTIPTNVIGTAVVYLTVSSDAGSLPTDGGLGFDAQLQVGAITAALGSVQVQVGAVSLDAPGTTGSLSVPVSGRAAAGDRVSVLENGAALGSAVASAGGFWQTQVALPDLGQGYRHQLIAQVGSGADLQQSAPATITYDKFQPTLTTLTLSQGHGSVTVSAGTSFPYVVVPSQPLAVSTTLANPDTVTDPAFVLSGTSFPATRNGAVFSATVPTNQLNLLNADEIDFAYTRQLPTGTTLQDVAGAIPTAAQARAEAGPLGAFIGPPSVVQNTDTEKKVTAPLTNGVTGTTTEDVTWSSDSSFSTAGLTKVTDGVWVDTPTFQVTGIGPTSTSTSTSTSSGSVAVTGHVYLTGAAATAAVRAQRRLHPDAPPVPLGPVISGFELLWNVGSNSVDLYGAATSSDKYSTLADLRAQIGLNCGANQQALTAEADAIFDKAIGKDLVSAGLTVAGLVLAPETFGIGTVVLWGLSYAIDSAMDSAIDKAIANLGTKVGKECKPLPNHSPPGPSGPSPGSGNQDGGNPTPIWDPSGTIYDGPKTSPLAGATVTILRSDSANGPWQVWDADDYDQGPNPQHTGAGGTYGWDVPVGWYKVSASAAGHLTAESQPLPVLPPQSGIDLMLASSAAPSVTAAVANADGTITLTFGTWMRAALLSANQITLTNSAGKPVPVTVTPIGAVASPAGDPLTKTVRLTPTGLDASVPQLLHVHVAGAVQDAAGRPLGSGVTSDVTIRAKAVLSVSGSTTIHDGAATTLTAVLTAGSTPVSGQNLTLQRLPAGAKVWSSVTTLKTGSSGAVALAVKPTANTQYRWLFAATTGYDSVVSVTRTVTVAQTVTVRAVATRVRHSTRAVVRIYGWIAPAVSGEKVTLQSYVKGAWRTTRYAATTRRQKLPDGRTTVGYVIVIPARTRGAVTYRVARAATKSNAAGYSASYRITVT